MKIKEQLEKLGSCETDKVKVQVFWVQSLMEGEEFQVDIYLKERREYVDYETVIEYGTLWEMYSDLEEYVNTVVEYELEQPVRRFGNGSC